MPMTLIELHERARGKSILIRESFQIGSHADEIYAESSTASSSDSSSTENVHLFDYFMIIGLSPTTPLSDADENYDPTIMACYPKQDAYVI